jgi:3,4-dihydroxy 2-butanone 4-phosphate synthase/GTP cyclohydrolase II
MSALVSIEVAIQAIAAGEMIILVDDEDRENEGDLVIAAEFSTPEAVNFMVTHARGLVCLALLEQDFKRLGIPMMVAQNTSPRQTAFGVSIEAREGVTTGISAFDRSHTILTAVNEECNHTNLVMPGHVFPLCAKPGGVLERNGHTEGGVDLARLAGLKSAAVICEVMNEDGSMARMPNLIEFAQQHQLKIASIQDLQVYRLQHDALVSHAAQSKLPVRGLGEFQLDVYQCGADQQEYVALSKPTADAAQVPLVRLHSACLTGDVLGSARCDCGQQLESALTQIYQKGGAVLYLPQEGRGIGLINKIKAYQLQDAGLDTVEANQKLGFADDLRDYGLAAQVLKAMGLTQLRLMTNNPRKVAGLQQQGIEVVEREPLEVAACDHNARYLDTKRDKLGHWVRINKTEDNA